MPKWSQIVPKWSQKVPKWSQMGPLWLPKDVQSDPGAWEGTFKTPHVFDKRETRSRLAKNTHVFECRARFDPRPPPVWPPFWLLWSPRITPKLNTLACGPFRDILWQNACCKGVEDSLTVNGPALNAFTGLCQCAHDTHSHIPAK